MIALLALLALLVGPVLFLGVTRRVIGRARAAGVHGTRDERRATVRTLVTNTEAGLTFLSCVLVGGALLTLAVLAVTS